MSPRLGPWCLGPWCLSLWVSGVWVPGVQGRSNLLPPAVPQGRSNLLPPAGTPGRSNLLPPGGPPGRSNLLPPERQNLYTPTVRGEVVLAWVDLNINFVGIEFYFSSWEHVQQRTFNAHAVTVTTHSHFSDHAKRQANAMPRRNNGL